MMIYKFKTAVLVACFLLTSMFSVAASNYPPTLDFQHLLNTYFDDSSGLISFRDARIIFAPDGQLNGKIVVVDADNQVLTDFAFYPDYKDKAGVYARALVKTPADINLAKAGIYNIVYMVDGTPVTRLPFRLLQSTGGDDPFNPVETLQFDGYWRSFAFIVMQKWKGEEFPEVHYWLGGMDLPEGKNRDRQIVALFRDGKIVAHSKRTTGEFKDGHFEETRSSLYHPHADGKEVNAMPFLLKDWLIDGVYELRVNRLADKTALRSYDFKVTNGKIEPHPRTIMGYQPQTDYIAPRVQRPGSTSLELAEAIWIEDRKIE